MSLFARAWFGAIAALVSGALLLASRDIGPYGALVPIAPVLVLVFALSARRWWSVVLAAFVARLIGGLGFAYAYFDLLPKPIVIGWIIGQALGFALTVLLTRWMAQRAAWMALLAFPLYTAATEFLFGMVSPHGSFGAYGYGLVDILPWLQVASLGGMAALSFLAALAGITLALLIARASAWRSALVVGALPIVLVTAFGFWRMSLPADTTERVGLIAIDALHGRNLGEHPDAGEVAQGYADAARTLANENLDVIVLPEGVFSGEDAQALLSQTAIALDTPILAGFVGRRDDGLRTNTALLLTEDGGVATYVKRKLIPGVDIGHVVGDGPLLRDHHGVAICKDFDFPAMIREYGERGATLMLAPAWDFRIDGRYHARLAVVRGVENGFALARAAADGNLTLSDRTGRIIAERTSDTSAPAIVVADVGLRSGGTLYTRIGDAFAWLCVIGIVVLIAMRLLGAPASSRQTPTEKTVVISP